MWLDPHSLSDEQIHPVSEASVEDMEAFPLRLREQHQAAAKSSRLGFCTGARSILTHDNEV